MERAETQALEAILREVANRLLPRGVDEPLWTIMAPSVLYPRQAPGVLQYIRRDAPCWYDIHVCSFAFLLQLDLNLDSVPPGLHHGRSIMRFVAVSEIRIDIAIWDLVVWLYFDD